MAAKNQQTSNKYEAMKVIKWTWPTRACTWIWSQRTCIWPWPQRACKWGWPQGACTWNWPQGACTWNWPQVPANEDGYKEPASEVGHRGPAHELKLATKGLQINLAPQSLLKKEAHVQTLAHTQMASEDLQEDMAMKGLQSRSQWNLEMAYSTFWHTKSQLDQWQVPRSAL